MSYSVLAARFCARALPSHCKQALPNFSLEKREAERRQAHPLGSRIADELAARANRVSPAARTLLSFRPRLRGRIKVRARPPFGAPPRLFGSGPRFLEPPGANGRTLPGTSAASTSQSDHAPDRPMPKAARKRGDEPRPRDRSRSVSRPSPVTPFLSGIRGAVTEIVTSVNEIVTALPGPSRPIPAPSRKCA
jgi:hypothetical protein